MLWSVVGRLSPRSGHSSTLVSDCLILSGGRVGDTFLNDCWRYDCKTRKLSVINDCSPFTPRAYLSSTPIGENSSEVCFIGGSDSKTIFSDVLILDLGTGVWNAPQIRGPLTDFPRGTHAAVQHPLMKKSVLVFGGYGGPQSSYLGDLAIFHADSGLWESLSPKGSLPSKRGYHKLATLKDSVSVLLCGGMNETGAVPSPDNCRVYDPRGNGWLDPIPGWGSDPGPRSNQGMTAVTGAGVLVNGGRFRKERLSDWHFTRVQDRQFEKSKSVSLEWNRISKPELCSPEIGRAGHTMEVWNDTLFVVGGYGGNGVTFGDIKAFDGIKTVISGLKLQEGLSGSLPASKRKHSSSSQAPNLTESSKKLDLDTMPVQSEGWISTGKKSSLGRKPAKRLVKLMGDKNQRMDQGWALGRERGSKYVDLTERNCSEGPRGQDF